MNKAVRRTKKTKNKRIVSKVDKKFPTISISEAIKVLKKSDHFQFFSYGFAAATLVLTIVISSFQIFYKKPTSAYLIKEQQKVSDSMREEEARMAKLQHKIKEGGEEPLIAGEKRERELIKVVEEGDTLGGIMNEYNIPYSQTYSLIKSLKGTFDIKRDLRPSSKTKQGTKLIFDVEEGYTAENNLRANLQKFTIEISPIERIEAIVEKHEDEISFDVRKIKDNKYTKLARKEAKIAPEQSIMYLAEKQDIPYNIIYSFYDIFSFDVDFEREIRPGDSFELLYEEEFSKEGKYLGVGKLLYGKLSIRGKEFKTYNYAKKEGQDKFYDEKGKGSTKALKKTPINKARISSTYGSRRHPVLGFRKNHNGVDFAAPTGTPIPAGGSGTIIYRGWKGPNGNLIKIRHNSTYTTAYAHLNSFKKGLRVGSYVKQGQIIGYVGSTGRSTGPHLHYGIQKNGRYVNPLTIKLPSTESLRGKHLKAFKKKRDGMNKKFEFLG
jgi:murein DD-endopeptidase MepM/ murein hydrolase activator NlpD